jgi:Zn-dependent protease/predicted transcriptional regulator
MVAEQADQAPAGTELPMRWSFRIARIAGIDVRIHFTFFLIILLGATYWGQSGPLGWAFGTLVILLLFLCVTLHEFGHSLVAQRFGIPVREIVLLPIGGVAMLERNPSRPLHELLIALAGPAVNILIIAVLVPVILAIQLLPGREHMRPEALIMGQLKPSLLTLLVLLVNANFWLAAFNMLPAFPLDGGRVLRAVLGFFMSFPRATRIAATVGQALAVVLGMVGFMYGNLVLVFIAVFIFLGAGAESMHAQARTVLATSRVGDAYNKHALVLTADDRISRVVDYLLTSYQPDFAVLHGRQLLGVVTREDVLQYLANNRYDKYVTEILREDVPRVDFRATLEEVRDAMAAKSSRVAAVYDGDIFLGLVSAEDIAEAYAILRFFRGEPAGGAMSVARAGGASSA